MQDWQDQFEAAERLLTIHKLMESCAAWAQQPPGTTRRTAYDKLSLLHERVITHFANMPGG